MIELTKLLQAQFDKMCTTGKLFRSELSGDQLWDIYISSFKQEDDPIFRDPNSSVHNCNNCKNFMRRYGNIVALDKDFNIMTIWDIKAPEEFKSPCESLSKELHKYPIINVFFETVNSLNSLPYESIKRGQQSYQLGIAKNIKMYTLEEAKKFGVVNPDEIRTFTHLNLKVPQEFVLNVDESIEAIYSRYRTDKELLCKGITKIDLDTLYLVKDLINQDSLLNGKTYLSKVDGFIKLKEAMPSVSQLDNWCWSNSRDNYLSRFANELIGTLCLDLAEGKDLNEACREWNRRVDPVNYMKATAPITKKQILEAKKFVEENGYEESFDRRCATIDDIKASEILHLSNNNVPIKSVSIFDNVKATASKHQDNEFKNIEEISIDKFMSDILPNCTSVEAFFASKHRNNLVTLTTANNPDSKPIFKWSNNYSWTFNGNIAGKSEIKEAVKKAGGNVGGVLRFSISWNWDGRSIVDFDAHAQEPNGIHIYFASFKARRTPYSGMLDVDMINPNDLGVENINWTDLHKMQDGVYKFSINNYNGRTNNGFRAEIEFDGHIYQFEQLGNVQATIQIANVILENGQFTLQPILPCLNSIDENIYGLDTNQFHKVNLVCLSPNYWGDNNIGNKHYFFMLENCKCDSDLRSFHNENLIPDLLQHRKVMEVLGTANMIKSTDNQLSGLGFNSTVRDELIVRLQGSFKRVLKIKF